MHSKEDLDFLREKGFTETADEIERLYKALDMVSEDDGGSAFPDPSLSDPQYIPNASDYGMRLRDWFAGQAIAGWMAHGDPYGPGVPDFANYAYEIADAMLKARRK